MFNSASSLIQDSASIVQCPGSEGYLAKSQPNLSLPHHTKINKNGSFACDTSCTKFKSYKICCQTIAVAKKEKYLEKFLWFVQSIQGKFSDLVNLDVSKNTGKKRHKVTQIRKGTKQVKENPVMYNSGSNANKQSLVNSCESDAIVSAASSSHTNQTEALDTFIAWKVNPRTDSENLTNYSQSFLPTPTRFIRQTTFYPEFSFNLNNHASTLSTALPQFRSTFNSNLSEPERLFYKHISAKSSEII